MEDFNEHTVKEQFDDEDDPITDDDDIVVLDGDLSESDTDDVPYFDVSNESSAILLSISESICSVKFHPFNGTKAIFGGCNNMTYITKLPRKYIEPSNSGPVEILYSEVLSGHQDSVSDISFSCDGSYFATAGCDGTVRVYTSNTETQLTELVCVLEGPTNELEFISWHPKGPAIFGGSYDSTGWLWTVPNGNVVSVLSGHSESITCGDFSVDGRTVYTGSLDGSIITWDAKTGRSIFKFQRTTLADDGIVSLQSHHTNSIVVAGSLNGIVSLIQPDTGKILTKLTGHSESVESLQFCYSADQPLLASGDMNGNLIIWDYNQSRDKVIMKHEKYDHSIDVLPGIVRVIWNPNDIFSIITGCIDGTIRIWDYRIASCVKVLKGHRSGILNLDIARNNDSFENFGLRIISTGDDGQCLLWDIRK
ncbi:hypothetical protein ACR3K2_15360 [Cryptosporidium serpentis]